MAGMDVVNAAVDRVSSTAGRRDASLASVAAHAAEAAELRRLAVEADGAAALANEDAGRAAADLETAYGELAGMGVPRDLVQAFVELRRNIVASVAGAPSLPVARLTDTPTVVEADLRDDLPEAVDDGVSTERLIPPQVEGHTGDGPGLPEPIAQDAGTVPMDTVASEGAAVPVAQEKVPVPRKRNRSKASSHPVPGAQVLNAVEGAALPEAVAKAPDHVGAAPGPDVAGAGVVEPEPLLPGLAPHVELPKADVVDPEAVEAPAPMDPALDAPADPHPEAAHHQNGSGRPDDWYERRNQPDPEDDDGQGRFDDVARDDGEAFPEVRDHADVVEPEGAGEPALSPPPAPKAEPESPVKPSAPTTAAPARPGRMGAGFMPPFLRPPEDEKPAVAKEPVEEDDPIPF